jgi:energy-coupling factor transporter ATP-binding protein EcfA2
MGGNVGIYVHDESTTCLHLTDVENLLGLLDRLVDASKSVIVIEHHQAVMAHVDWIIDLGPGAGHDGGRIVFEGTPGGPGGGTLHAHWRAPGGLRGCLTQEIDRAGPTRPRVRLRIKPSFRPRQQTRLARLPTAAAEERR